MHHSSESSNRPDESAVRHRLAMMWFANSYPHYVRKNGTVSQSDTVPVEYLPPYPNPWYWPKNNPNTKQAQSNKRLTATEATRAATASPTNIEPIIYPSWLEFWQGKPPEYPLPEIPNVIIPDIAPSSFMDVFRETDGLRLPRKQDLKSPRASIVQTNDVSTVQGLTEYRAANSTIPWIIEKHTSSEPQATTVVVNTTKDNSTTLKTINSAPVETSNIKQYRVVGKKGEEILVPVDETGATIRVVDSEGNPIELPKFTGDIVTFNVGTDGGRIEIEISKDLNHGELGTTIITNGVYDFRYYRDTIIEYAEEEIIVTESPVERMPFTQEFQNYYEEICCAGLNPDDGFLDAVIIVKQEEGYSGGLCSHGSFESVGFWLNEPNQTELEWNWWTPPLGPIASTYNPIWVGEAHVAVHDIPRYIYPYDSQSQPFVNGYLHYTVRVPLTESIKQYINKCSENARLPRLWCLLSWNNKVTPDDLYRLESGWGDFKEFDVQFPVEKIKQIPNWELKLIPASASQTVWGIHVANLYRPNFSLLNNNVLIYAGSGLSQSAADEKDINESAGIFNPKYDYLSHILPPPYAEPLGYSPVKDPNLPTKKFNFNQADLFCSGHSVLPDGRIFIAGGNQYGKE